MLIQLEFKNYNIQFSNPEKIIESNSFLHTQEKLEELEIEIENGKYIAGFISYEFGYFFQEKLLDKFKTHIFEFPLFRFGVFTNYKPIQNGKQEPKVFQVQNLSQNINFGEYKKSITNIHKNLSIGETYQVNFTFQNEFNFSGDEYSFYKELKKNQSSNYSSFIESEEFKILSISPELFFEIHENEILMKPMKGTLETHDLKITEKLKSENHIIVDLIRNDLGKISKFGSVKIESLLEVENYSTLNQLTSSIRSTLKEEITFSKLLASIFPGGSITGAPKLKTMEIILKEEKNFREIYTGAIGFYSKAESIFSLAIRTIQIKNGYGKLGIGSGIIFDSNAEDEFSESNLKMKFFLKSIPIFLFETILWKRGNFYYLKKHFLRIKLSSDYFGFEIDEDKFNQSLEQYIKNLNIEKVYRIKIILDRFNKLKIESTEIQTPKKKIGKIQIAEKRIDSKNIFQFHKTSNREIYTEYKKKADDESLEDYIFMNEKEEITEGTIYNLFVKIGKIYYTPTKESGILNGIFRQKLLNRSGFKEKKINLDELKNANEIFLCNSVRGIKRVKLY